MNRQDVYREIEKAIPWERVPQQQRELSQAFRSIQAMLDTVNNRLDAHDTRREQTVADVDALVRIAARCVMALQVWGREHLNVPEKPNPSPLSLEQLANPEPPDGSWIEGPPIAGIDGYRQW